MQLFCMASCCGFFLFACKMYRLLFVASTALTVVFGYFEASRTCSGCQWIEDEAEKYNCYNYCSRRGRAIDASRKYFSGDSCNDCPYEMDRTLQGQCWDVCARRSVGVRAAGSIYTGVACSSCARATQKQLCERTCMF